MTASPPSIPEFLPNLISAARTTDGAPPFSDQSLVDVRTGQRSVVALGEEAVALVSPTEAEFVVHPDARGQGLGTQLLEQLLANSPTGLLIWAHGDHPAARALAASHGLEAVRELLHLRAELDDTAETSGVAPGTTTELPTETQIRPFRIGHDEPAWLELNARAFSSHPEQGQVTRDDLDELFRENWFSADDFLVLETDGTMVGYCWLKIDAGEGEFYVVGVDPAAQGSGWGRILTRAGLARLRQRGIRSAHLYVEGENTAAVKLYRSLGFSDDSIDIQYRGR
ncbi:MAG TPA: mycothiol synthase [Glaciihabitans sp.]|nr:mycothiol synthase [Glaciihabitans sp.]